MQSATLAARGPPAQSSHVHQFPREVNEKKINAASAIGPQVAIRPPRGKPQGEQDQRKIDWGKEPAAPQALAPFDKVTCCPDLSYGPQ